MLWSGQAVSSICKKKSITYLVATIAVLINRLYNEPLDTPEGGKLVTIFLVTMKQQPDFSYQPASLLTTSQPPDYQLAT